MSKILIEHDGEELEVYKTDVGSKERLLPAYLWFQKQFSYDHFKSKCDRCGTGVSPQLENANRFIQFSAVIDSQNDRFVLCCRCCSELKKFLDHVPTQPSGGEE